MLAALILQESKDSAGLIVPLVWIFGDVMWKPAIQAWSCLPHLFSFSYKNWTLIQNEEKNTKLRQKKFGGFCLQGPSKFLITSTRAGQTHLKKTNIQLKINKQTNKTKTNHTKRKRKPTTNTTFVFFYTESSDHTWTLYVCLWKRERC